MKSAGRLFVPSLTGCLLVASLLSLSSCISVHGPMTSSVDEEPQAETSGTESEPPVQVQYGVASWYGKGFHGRPTASGETYDMHLNTAAHRTVPLGTYATVTNLENGQTTRVRINDRGPYVRGRILDLSYESARQIDMVRTGSARVKVEFMAPEASTPPVVSRPVTPELRPVVTWQEQLSPPAVSAVSGGQPFAVPDAQPYAVQAGAYQTPANAARAQKTLASVHPHIWIAMASENAPTIHRVRLGPFQNRAEAERVAHAVKARGYAAAVVAMVQ